MKAWVYPAMIRVVRWTDQSLGIGAIFWLLLPWTLWEMLRRRRDFRYFARLRNRLPKPFWQGTCALKHFLRMIFRWQGSIATCILCDRLSTPRWSKRCSIVGIPPDRLPDWGRRPVVLTFIHLDGFATIAYWLRSKGIPTSILSGWPPPPLDQKIFKSVSAMANSEYGLGDYPDWFITKQMKAMIQSIVPDRVLAIALDGIATAGPLLEHPFEGTSIQLKDGAFRIAARHSAILMPVSIEQTGFLRFTLRFGEPVPEEWMRDAEPSRSHEHLLSQLWDVARRDPCSLTWSTLESLKSLEHGENQSRVAWP
jgi:hypothetical protein